LPGKILLEYFADDLVVGIGGVPGAGVAHELNQPLAVVEITAGDICLRLMEDVRGVVDRMSGTVDHLRVFSRDVSEEPR